MNNTASVGVGYLIPKNDLVCKILLRNFGEAGFVFETLEVCTLEGVKERYAVLALEFLLVVGLGGIVVLLLALYVETNVGHFLVYRKRYVCAESPGSSRPNENIIVSSDDRKLEEYSLVLDLLI